MKIPRLYDPLSVGGSATGTVTQAASLPTQATSGPSPILPHAANLKSGTAVQVASHISTQQKIVDWVESLPATLENAETRLKAEEQLAVTWYAGHKVAAYCLGSFAAGLALAVALFVL